LGQRCSRSGRWCPSSEGVFCLSSLLMGAILSLACNSVSLPTDPPPTARQLVKACSIGVDPPAALSLAGEPRTLHIYIDSSMSMRGFVASPEAKYFEILDRLLDDASSAGFHLTIDGFSEDIRELGKVKSSVLLDPYFYSGGETSFPKLFEHVAKERGRGTISIIVSDLVQSGNTGDQRALLAALQDILRTQPEIQLLAFRSAFVGPYFVEGRKVARRRLELSLDGTSRERSRPFYVLIIADSREDLEKVRAYLQPQMDGVTGEQLPLEFNATGPALSINTIEFSPPQPDALIAWNAFEAPRRLASSGGGPSRFLLSYLDLMAPTKDTGELRLRLRIGRPPAEGEIRSVEHLSFDVSRCFLKGERRTPAEPLDITPEAWMPEKDRIDVSYQFPRPHPGRWDAYRIRITPGPGNLQPPVWVLDWSTLDDSSQGNGFRTLKLEAFIDTMIRSVKEKVSFSEQYILLGRGE
jgi:hypothetical protein